MKKVTQVLVLVLVLGAGFAAQAKAIRVSEANPAELLKVLDGKNDLTLEFRQGDVIPLQLLAQGDLLETKSTGTIEVTVKRNFWLHLYKGNVEISLDGSVFRPIPEVLSGSVSAGASADPNNWQVSAIALVLSAQVR